MLLVRRVVVWAIGSTVATGLISLPLWLIGPVDLPIHDPHFVSVLIISVLWVACDHASTANSRSTSAIWPDVSEVAPHFPRVIGALTLVGLWLSVADFAWHAGSPPGRTALIGGLGVAGAGLALRCHAITTLREFFTERLLVLPSQPLIMSGAFRWVRHPSYGGWLLILLGVDIVLESRWAIAWYLAIVVPMVLLRIRIEERIMVDAYGPVYVEYCQKTKKLIPRVF